MCNEPQGDFRYVDLWERRIQLFWSRLQTATAIQTGVMIAWYFLIQERKFEHSVASLALIVFGIILHWKILVIMQKDSEYIDAMTKKAGDCFPSYFGSNNKEGRGAGRSIIRYCIGFLVILGLTSIYIGYRFLNHRVI